jgi:Domain of unknown function (DUF6468)
MSDLSIFADLLPYATLSMLLDGGLVLLLAATLLYVARLNRRIGELKRERTHFDAAIERFAGAAAETHRAMAELRQTADGEGRILQDHVKKGAGIAEDLEFLIGRATSAADRLESVIGQSRQAESRKNEGRPAEPRKMKPVARDLPPVQENPRAAPTMPVAKDLPPVQEMARTASRDLSKATAWARAITGDRSDLKRASTSPGGPATVTRRPVAVESLPEGERALLKALAGLR